MSEWSNKLKEMFESETGEKWIIQGTTDEGGYSVQRNKRQFLWFESKLEKSFNKASDLTKENKKLLEALRIIMVCAQEPVDDDDLKLIRREIEGISE